MSWLTTSTIVTVVAPNCFKYVSMPVGVLAGPENNMRMAVARIDGTDDGIELYLSDVHLFHDTTFRLFADGTHTFHFRAV